MILKSFQEIQFLKKIINLQYEVIFYIGIVKVPYVLHIDCTFLLIFFFFFWNTEMTKTLSLLHTCVLVATPQYFFEKEIKKYNI